jgi:protease stability complex PrcB-like protein
LLAAALLAGCGRAGSGTVTPQSVPFTDHGQTDQSRVDDGPKIVVGTAPPATGLAELVPSADPARLYIGVFAGMQRTGGHAVKVERIERTGDRLDVTAKFSSPPRDALTIQVITTAAQLVSIDRRSVAGVREAILRNESGKEMARTTVPQSQP